MPAKRTRGSNDCGNPPCPDIFVTKVDMAVAGSASVIWSTYLGADSSDYGYGITLDTSGGVYLTGATFSIDFPTTPGAYDRTADMEPGGRDGFVVKIVPSTPATASFVYDGDGNRVKATVGLTTTVYVGDYAEWRNGTLTKYYYAGDKLVAMREGSQQAKWLLGDRLGSTSITADVTGTKRSEMRYKAWGETRYSWGTTATTFRYTGQRQEPDLGLYFYGARWYDPAFGRFIQPDTIVPAPGNALAFDRYAYVYNNPLKYNDPSGHCPAIPEEYGAAICFSLFIADYKVQAGPFTVKGDNRGFRYGSDEGASRAYVWISLDNPGMQYIEVNPTVYFIPGTDRTLPEVGPSSQNKVSIIRNNDGSITVMYDVVIAGPLEEMSAHINGTITFIPDGKGGYTAVGFRDGYPWAEAYYRNPKGNVAPIFRRPAVRGDPYDLSAIENGRPWWMWFTSSDFGNAGYIFREGTDAVSTHIYDDPPRIDEW